jgi:hypothetical protein
MNHGVAIRTNNGKVIKFRLARFGSIAERFEVMHLSVISAKLAINDFKIKTASWHFAFEPAVSQLFCGSNFGVA